MPPKTKSTTKLKSSNQTKKNKNNVAKCPIGLKAFEENFGKRIALISKTKLKNIETLKKAEFATELLSRFAPLKITPSKDFYDYINYLWLTNVSLEKQQKYIVQVDNFRLTQDKVYHELNDIIVDYYTKNHDKLATNLKKYHKSIIDMNSKTYTKKLAQEAVELVDDFIKKDNPWALLAYFNNDEMLANNAPLVWSTNPDLKEPTINRSSVNPCHFIILDLNVYYDDGTDVSYKQKYRNTYHKHVGKIFETLLGKNDFNEKDPYDVQVAIFGAFGCPEIIKNENANYNKVDRKDALSKYGFDWDEFSKYLGFKHPPDSFIASSLKFLKCGSKLFVDNWKTPKWRTYWVYLLLRRLCRITKGWEDVMYEFHGNFERGQQAINKTDSVSASLYMTVPFNTFLTNEYIKKYENPQKLEYATVLCNDLKLVFKRILTRNTWLQPSTKKYALKKLDNFRFIIGNPPNLREDPDLNYGDELYDNMKLINDWRHIKFLELEEKPLVDIPMVDWTSYPVKMSGSQAYIVNASYTPARNAIYINLGYIQPPFIDLHERGIEYNLANIGFVLGHEMSHGFDDSGSKYGHDGKLNDWWTEKDKKTYKKIQANVVKQYEAVALRDGIKFDASITTGEDLADISGIAICEEYLRDFQDNNTDIIPIRALSYEAFYTYFAFQQRQVVNKKAISAQLKTNPHPLDKYRCNVPLSRSSIFRALYNVKKGDGMWWENTDTIF
jgi:putative endopeptidase